MFDDVDTYPWKQNLKPFKNRTIDFCKPVRVFRNLTKGMTNGLPWYSVMQGGKVVAHTQFLMLGDAKFIVSEAGRQRVIREKKKYVHAFVEGRIKKNGAMGMLETDNQQLPAKVTYNPYKNSTFMTATAGGISHQIHGAMAVCINKYGVTAAYTF